MTTGCDRLVLALLVFGGFSTVTATGGVWPQIKAVTPETTAEMKTVMTADASPTTLHLGTFRRSQ